MDRELEYGPGTGIWPGNRDVGAGTGKCAREMQGVTRRDLFPLSWKEHVEVGVDPEGVALM